jgi:DNA-binding MarR family transcriptional regulator
MANTLEELIHQSSPITNPKQRALVNFIYTNSVIQGKLKLHFNRFGITPQQYNVLRILRGASKPVSIQDIRQRMLDQNSDASRLVERLAVKKMASKFVCPADKRLVDISITSLGLDLLTEIEGSNTPFYDVFFAKLDTPELDFFNAILDKLRE